MAGELKWESRNLYCSIEHFCFFQQNLLQVHPHIVRKSPRPREKVVVVFHSSIALGTLQTQETDFQISLATVAKEQPLPPYLTRENRGALLAQFRDFGNMVAI